MLAASFPNFALKTVRDWILKGRPSHGLPAVVNFLKEAHKQGYEVHITIPVLGRKTDYKPFIHKDHIIVHPYPLPSLFLPIIKILQIKGSIVLRILYPLLTLLFSFGFHKRLLSRLQPDFIYQMGFSILLGHFLHKSSGCPLIHRLFGTLNIWSKTKQLTKKLSLWQRYVNLTELFIYRHPGSLVVISNDGTRGDKVMEKFGVPEGKRLFLINGLNHGDNESYLDIRSIFPTDTFLVAAMGRLVASKGIDRILCALPEALEYVPELKLVIIGDGRQRKKLESIAESLGVSSVVRFVGQISHDKIVNTLKQADLYISAQYLSNLSNCTLEAVLAGIPIISLADGSLDSLFENGEDSILLNPKNAEKELPQAIKKIARDKAFNRRLRRGIKKRREEVWTWHDRISFELKAIERIISKSKQ